MRRFALTNLRDFGMGKKACEDKIIEECQHLIEVFKNFKGKINHLYKTIQSSLMKNIRNISFQINIVIKLQRRTHLCVSSDCSVSSAMSCIYEFFKNCDIWSVLFCFQVSPMMKKLLLAESPVIYSVSSQLQHNLCNIKILQSPWRLNKPPLTVPSNPRAVE